MDLNQISDYPNSYSEMLKKSKEIGFNMCSDSYVGNLLKTLVSAKPNGNFLELGTGLGLALSWMIDGMDEASRIITIDNDGDLVKIATSYFGQDERVTLVTADAGSWLQTYDGPKFDLVFADAWPGKYSHLGILLKLIKPGGFYIIDDMLKQPNWPEGHEALVSDLMMELEKRNDMRVTWLNWSTGIVIAVKK